MSIAAPCVVGANSSTGLQKVGQFRKPIPG